jgi:predicted AAA+ superfamily ATPase
VFTRALLPLIEDALADTPVVMLVGARQAGKSTMCRELLSRGLVDEYRSLDDATSLDSARRDPSGFVASLPPRVVLDEVQRAPNLFLAIKKQVDERRTPGSFLLTGSANVLLLPNIADSLAGRMEIQTLWPLSESEIEGWHGNFVDAVMADSWKPRGLASLTRAGLMERILRGGFPEATARLGTDRRARWFDSYVRTILERDVREIARLEALTVIPDLLTLLASRIGGLHNAAEVSRSSGLPATTVKRHMALLEIIYMTVRLPGWWSKRAHRLIRAPKIVLTDTGIASRLTRADEKAPETEPARFGALLENFVVMELTKQASWSRERPELSHFRTPSGREVDLVLEGRGKRLVGIEIKATATPRADDFRALEHLREVAGQTFLRGVLLHGGSDVLPFGDRLLAVPFSALWSGTHGSA